MIRDSRAIAAIGLALATLALAAPEARADVTPTAFPLGVSGARAVLATAEEGAALLGRSDPFTSAMSPFDRAARLESAEPVDEATLLRFAAAQTLTWTAEEVARMGRALAQVSGGLERLSVTVPADILFVKTTGREEGGAAYTRGRAVMLPEELVLTPVSGAGPLPAILAHEIFHVMSRADPALRARAYRVVEFDLCAPIPLPATLGARRITNPDAPAIDCVSEFVVEGATITATPILLARQAYDPKLNRGMFGYLEVKYLAVRRTGAAYEVALEAGEPRLFEASSLRELNRKYGKNTGYVIHPEEVLADNFALLVLEESGATPRILEDLRKALTGP